jgi:hypothetical protein
MVTRIQDLSPEAQHFQSVFFPYATQKLMAVAQGDQRFVHYTTAEVAASILENSTVWMRNALTMNDFSEIQHGLNCISYAWRGEVGRSLRDLLDYAHPGISADLEQRFDAWQPDMRANTYLTCLSEHQSDEDTYGRLSMWRAYGGRSGIALVINSRPFTTVSEGAGVYSSPVEYETPETFAEKLGGYQRGLEVNKHLLGALPRGQLLETLFNVLRFAALCTKHPAFAEEAEWRVMYAPNIERSPVVVQEVRTVRGVPQLVQMLPLRRDASDGQVAPGSSIPELLDRIIIGPTEDAAAVYQAFEALLSAAGVAKPAEKLVISGVPLRHL